MNFSAKTLIATFLALALLCGAAQARPSRLYFAGYLGLSEYNELDFNESTGAVEGNYRMDNATNFAGALGVRLTPQWRMEGELSYRNPKMSHMDLGNAGVFDLGGHIKSWILMFNAYYDFDYEVAGLSPFVGAGLGLASHNAEIDDTSGLAADNKGNALGLAWQVGSGLKYNIGKDTALTGSYRYLGTSDIDIGGYSLEYGGHEFRVGLEYSIPAHLLTK